MFYPAAISPVHVVQFVHYVSIVYCVYTRELFLYDFNTTKYKYHNLSVIRLLYKNYWYMLA